MSQNSRKRVSTQLRLEGLEGRIVPATWPVDPGTGPQILATYGQYQDNPAGGLIDAAIGLHEGVDIQGTGADIPAPGVIAQAGTAVRAITAGVVEAVYRDIHLNPSSSFIVIRDANGTLGWNYKHVIASETLRVGDAVAEGENIGQMAPYVGLPDHIHIDRGTAAGAPLPGRYRDVTIPKSHEVASIAFNVAEALRFLLEPNTPAALRANAVFTVEAGRRLLDALRWQYAPSLNPLSEFKTAFPDVLAPTISGVDFQFADSDGLGPQVGQAADRGERRRSNAFYFDTTVTISGTVFKKVGFLAGGSNAKAETTGVGDRNIDFVVDAYDTFATAGRTSNTKLGVASLDFRVTGRKFNGDSGKIQSFDFSAFPTYEGVTDFLNRGNARATFENDTNHNSTRQGPFWYNATNTPNANLVVGPPVPGGIRDEHRQFSWNSAAPTGATFASMDRAADNAHSSYPDDIYDIMFGVSDLQGNRTTKTVTVVLLNWERTIELDIAQRMYTPDDIVTVSTGEQYRSNQAVDLYVLPANFAAFGGATKITVNTDANGKLPQAALGKFAPGLYAVVADYNGDGVYTPNLDAQTLFLVAAGENAPGVASVSLSSSTNPSWNTQNVTFTATIQPTESSSPPSGRVDFYDGSERVGTAEVSSSGVATWSTTALSVGDHSISAHFVFDDYPERDELATAIQAVNANDTAVSLSANFSSTGTGNEVALTATVTPSGTPVSGVPSGSVNFYDGDLFIGSADVDEMGVATLTASNLIRGTHVLNASYSGDAVFQSGLSPSQAGIVANNVPAVSDVGAITHREAPVAVDALVGSFDIDGDTLSIVSFTQGSHGSVYRSSAGFVYTPAANFVGTDTFTYTVSDGFGGSATGTVTIVVLPRSDAQILGTVYRDVTGNGRTGDDVGWAGVRVYVDTNGNKTLDAGERVATTDAAGQYALTGLAPGAYTVRQVAPAQSVRTHPTLSDAWAVTLGESQIAGGTDFANFSTRETSKARVTGVQFAVNGTPIGSNLRDRTDAGDEVSVTFTVTAGAPVVLSLVSYTAPAPKFDARTASQQRIAEVATGTFGPGTYTLSVRNPGGFFQVDFVCGPVIDLFGPAGSNIFYSAQNRLLSADNG